MNEREIFDAALAISDSQQRAAYLEQACGESQTQRREIEGLLDAVDEFPGAVVVVTHDEQVLERVANRLVIFDRGKTTLFEGGYRDFLDRIGWETEADGKASATTGATVLRWIGGVALRRFLVSDAGKSRLQTKRFEPMTSSIGIDDTVALAALIKLQPQSFDTRFQIICTLG